MRWVLWLSYLVAWKYFPEALQEDGAQEEPDELPELRKQRLQSSEAELKAMRQITEEEVTHKEKAPEICTEGQV